MKKIRDLIKIGMGADLKRDPMALLRIMGEITGDEATRNKRVAHSKLRGRFREKFGDMIQESMEADLTKDPLALLKVAARHGVEET